MELFPRISFPKKTFAVIDSHTMGEPTRIVINGFPELEGNTIMEKKQFLEKKYDHLRTALMLEPKGHKDMFGAIIMEPCNKSAHYGVIFMDSGGYLNMCGHGSIGTATVLVETKLITPIEPYTEVILEAPAGLIKTSVRVEHGKAVEVSFCNVPSFLYMEDVKIETKKYGTITLDISFGGSFFLLVNIAQTNLTIGATDLPEIKTLAMEILEKINQDYEIEHPYLDIKKVDLVEFYGPSNNPNATLKNVVIFGSAQVDRCPCGTGTSAKLATLYAKGKIGINEEFVYESITGSLFKGIVTEAVMVGEYPGIIPKITGSAYITGINTLLINEEDPLRYGFLLDKNA